MERKNSANKLSRECIEIALIKLSYEKELSDITISELTEKAGVSRVTFYRNYDSKEQIITDKIEDLFSMYSLEVQKSGSGTFNDREHLEHYLKFMYDHRFYFEGFINCGYGPYFLEKLTAYLENKWATENRSRYKLIAYAGGIYNIFVYWYKEGYATPIDALIGKL